MNFWILLWKVLFVAAITVFAAMSVWVTIGGWQDIKTLFARLDEEHQKKEESSKDGKN